MSTRSTILGNLVTELGTITTANGYATDVGEVLADVKHSQETNVGPGKVSVQIEDEGDDDATHVGAGHKALIAMKVMVRGAIEGAIGAGVPYALASSFAVDVRKLVAKPIVLGAAVRLAAVKGVGPINLSRSDAIVHIPLEIVYSLDDDTS